MSKPIISNSALSDFHCLGAQCEDSCCRHWDISFDKKHYDKLKASVIDAGEDPTLLDQHLFISETSNEKNYADVMFDENGACSFLDDCGLCKIHAEHGVETLSNVCTFFPRFFVQFEDRYEVSGSLSCPELARKTLLADQSFGIQEVQVNSLPRDHDYPVSNELMYDEDNIYLAKFSIVREALLKIMSDDSVSFETKLYSMSSLANAISTYYFEGCNPMQIRQLDNDLKTFSSSLKLTHTQLMLDQYIPQDPLAIIVVQAVLRLRVQRFPDEEFSRIINASFEYYEKKLESVSVLPDGNFPPEALMSLYQVEARKLNSEFPELMDKVFSRYTQNSIFREMYTSMPNLFTYIHMLTIRVAMLKFLIVSHPEVIDLLNSGLDKRMQQKLLEKKIVEVIYQFSRSIDHNMSFLEIVFYAITEQEMMHYDFSLPFIKLQESA